MKTVLRNLVCLAACVGGLLSPDRCPDLSAAPPASVDPALPGEARENVKFRWALGAFIGQSQAYVPITKDTMLKSGDEIKMVVARVTHCHVYVLHQSSQGEFHLLFPYALRAAAPRLQCSV